MTNWGEGANLLGDNFLKAYTTIQQNSRANEEAERLKAALALEQVQAEQERQAVAEWIKAQQANKTKKTGFLETPTTPIQSGKPTLKNPSAGGDFQVYDPTGTVKGLPTTPQGLVTNQGGGQFGMMSDQNDLKDLYIKLAATNPRKYLPLLQKDDSSADKLATMLMIAQMNNNAKREGYTSKEGIAADNNEMKKYIADMLDKAKRDKSSGMTTPTLKFQNDYSKASAKKDELNNQLDDIENHADRLLKSRLDRITGVMGIVPNVPGTSASDAQASLNSFKAKIGLSTLANLKSGTGAGLGQVTEAEHKLLQNYLSELENAQSEKSIRESLKRIQKWSQGAKTRINNGYDKSIFGRYEREQNGETQPVTSETTPKTTIRYDAKGNRIK